MIPYAQSLYDLGCFSHGHGQVYQPLLPGAIQRFAGSQKLIQTVNSQLSQQMTPGSRCSRSRSWWTTSLTACGGFQQGKWLAVFISIS